MVAFAPTSPEGRRVIPEALEGIPVELRLVSLLGAHGWRTAWSRLGWPPAERLLGRFDVLHFTDWMYPPQRAGLRATTIHDLVPLHFPEWVTGRTRSMHGRKYANAARTCDVMFANSAFTADDTAATLGFPRERIVVAHPGIGAEFSADGEAADLGAPYLLTVATLEPRKNLGTLVDAFALLADDELSLAVVGGEGWGPQPRARPGRRRAARPRLGRGAGAALSRRRSGRLPVAVRGLRDADHRGDGLGRAGRRLGAPVAWTRPAARQRCAPTPRAPRRSRLRSATRSAAARSCGRRGSSTPRGFSWAQTGETFLEGYLRFS